MPEPIVYDRRIFAENLLRLMRERQERQIDLARLLNVSKSTVSSYCSAQQLPRMDKIEQLALHFGVTRSALLGEEPEKAVPEDAAPMLELWRVLNRSGREELLRYGGYLTRQEPYRQPETDLPQSQQIRRWLRPEAICAVSPREGEDYVWIPRAEGCPPDASFCLEMPDDSMEPYLPAGSLLYVIRDLPLEENQAGLFLVRDRVLVRQWCPDYLGRVDLCPANPLRFELVLSLSDREPGCLYLGKVHTRGKLPVPASAFRRE